MVLALLLAAPSHLDQGGQKESRYGEEKAIGKWGLAETLMKCLRNQLLAMLDYFLFLYHYWRYLFARWKAINIWGELALFDIRVCENAECKQKNDLIIILANGEETGGNDDCHKVYQKKIRSILNKMSFDEVKIKYVYLWNSYKSSQSCPHCEVILMWDKALLEVGGRWRRCVTQCTQWHGGVQLYKRAKNHKQLYKLAKRYKQL